jgi:hypothetical protein
MCMQPSTKLEFARINLQFGPLAMHVPERATYPTTSVIYSKSAGIHVDELRRHSNVHIVIDKHILALHMSLLTCADHLPCMSSRQAMRQACRCKSNALPSGFPVSKTHQDPRVRTSQNILTHFMHYFECRCGPKIS